MGNVKSNTSSSSSTVTDRQHPQDNNDHGVPSSSSSPSKCSSPTTNPVTGSTLSSMTIDESLVNQVPVNKVGITTGRDHGDDDGTSATVTDDSSRGGPHNHPHSSVVSLPSSCPPTTTTPMTTKKTYLPNGVMDDENEHDPLHHVALGSPSTTSSISSAIQETCSPLLLPFATVASSSRPPANQLLIASPSSASASASSFSPHQSPYDYHPEEERRNKIFSSFCSFDQFPHDQHEDDEDFDTVDDKHICFMMNHARSLSYNNFIDLENKSQGLYPNHNDNNNIHHHHHLKNHIPPT